MPNLYYRLSSFLPRCAGMMPIASSKGFFLSLIPRQHATHLKNTIQKQLEVLDSLKEPLAQSQLETSTLVELC